MSYALRALWWTVLAPLLLLALPGVVLALGGVDDAWRASLLALSCLPLVLWALIHISEHHSVRVRADGVVGAWRTVDELGRLDPAQPVSLVGGAWSFVLSNRPPGHPRVYTRSLRGVRREDGREWWGAGATIGEVASDLRRRGMALTGHPSVLTATLGGWIASASHGSGGTLWKKSIGGLRILDRATGGVFTAGDAALFGPAADATALSRYAILEVEVLPVANVPCTRVAFDLTCEADARRYLTAPSYVRVLFVNAREATCFLWVPPPSVAAGTRAAAWWLPPWLWSILPSFAGGRMLDRRRWTRRMPLSESHAFGPTPPAAANAIVASLYVNFELFVHTALTACQLWQATRCLQACLHGRAGGRVDIRGGSGSWTFFDVALFRPDAAAVRAILEAIASVVGASAPVALHRGKASVPLAPTFVRV